ncbi:P10 [Hyphantria cunea nucleopolyhedrovirus]|uniref:P10 n=1 Tax=Hyphantria cunea nuclear polyhedrosis virus TaxID=28288 RepID=Q2NNS7_NPVHC|nr:P10 [Hyphantria cunea nucleopolyhedrovirus]BAE72309.1 P10 [Hyphantria cunea nucleopolyhedrovirus]
MSKPSILQQILTAVQDVDAKVDALQAQLTELDGKVQPLDGLSEQLAALDIKVTTIQDILGGAEIPDVPDVPLPLPDNPLNKTRSKSGR